MSTTRPTGAAEKTNALRKHLVNVLFTEPQFMSMEWEEMEAAYSGALQDIRDAARVDSGSDELDLALKAVERRVRRVGPQLPRAATGATIFIADAFQHEERGHE